jgi:hypothetical protein
MARKDKRRIRHNAAAGNIAAGTHYFELTKSSQGNLAGFYLRYGATLAATFTYETTSLEEVLFNSSTTGDWYVETDVTIAAAASAAAGKQYHCGNNGADRARIVAVVATGGALDIAVTEKS